MCINSIVVVSQLDIKIWLVACLARGKYLQSHITTRAGNLCIQSSNWQNESCEPNLVVMSHQTTICLLYLKHQQEVVLILFVITGLRSLGDKWHHSCIHQEATSLWQRYCVSNMMRPGRMTDRLWKMALAWQMIAFQCMCLIEYLTIGATSLDYWCLSCAHAHEE